MGPKKKISSVKSSCMLHKRTSYFLMELWTSNMFDCIFETNAPDITTDSSSSRLGSFLQDSDYFNPILLTNISSICQQKAARRKKLAAIASAISAYSCVVGSGTAPSTISITGDANIPAPSSTAHVVPESASFNLLDASPVTTPALVPAPAPASASASASAAAAAPALAPAPAPAAARSIPTSTVSSDQSTAVDSATALAARAPASSLSPLSSDPAEREEQLRIRKQIPAGRPKLTHLCQQLARSDTDPHMLIAPHRYGVSGEAGEGLTQPFDICVHPQVGLLTDFHSHLCEAEVIGLLAGRWDAERGVLYVQAPFPCHSTERSDDDGSMDVELDPVAELKIREVINNMGLSVVGWYHSHPRFCPDPSVTDIFNQQQYQRLMRDEGSGVEPFVGLIVSSFDQTITNPVGVHQWFHVMPFIVENSRMRREVFVPVMLNVDVVPITAMAAPADEMSVAEIHKFIAAVASARSTSEEPPQALSASLISLPELKFVNSSDLAATVSKLSSNTILKNLMSVHRSDDKLSDDQDEEEVEIDHVNEDESVVEDVAMDEVEKDEPAPIFPSSSPKKIDQMAKAVPSKVASPPAKISLKSIDVSSATIANEAAIIKSSAESNAKLSAAGPLLRCCPRHSRDSIYQKYIPFEGAEMAFACYCEGSESNDQQDTDAVSLGSKSTASDRSVSDLSSKRRKGPAKRLGDIVNKTEPISLDFNHLAQSQKKVKAEVGKFSRDPTGLLNPREATTLTWSTTESRPSASSQQSSVIPAVASSIDALWGTTSFYGPDTALAEDWPGNTLVTFDPFQIANDATFMLTPMDVSSHIGSSRHHVGGDYLESASNVSAPDYAPPVEIPSFFGNYQPGNHNSSSSGTSSPPKPTSVDFSGLLFRASGGPDHLVRGDEYLSEANTAQGADLSVIEAAEGTTAVEMQVDMLGITSPLSQHQVTPVPVSDLSQTSNDAAAVAPQVAPAKNKSKKKAPAPVAAPQQPVERLTRAAIRQAEKAARRAERIQQGEADVDSSEEEEKARANAPQPAPEPVRTKPKKKKYVRSGPGFVEGSQSKSILDFLQCRISPVCGVARELVCCSSSHLRFSVVSLVSLCFYYSVSSKRVDWDKKWQEMGRLDKAIVSLEPWVTRMAVSKSETKSFLTQVRACLEMSWKESPKESRRNRRGASVTVDLDPDQTYIRR